MGCIQTGRAKHPPKRENMGLDSTQSTFSFGFGPSPGQTGVQGQDNLFQFGKNTLWVIQELWPQPVTTTRSAWRDWGRDGQHGDQHQNEGTEAEGKRREMMAGNLHLSQRWSEMGRVQGRGSQVCGEPPLHPSCDKGLAPHAAGPPGPSGSTSGHSVGEGQEPPRLTGGDVTRASALPVLFPPPPHSLSYRSESEGALGLIDPRPASVVYQMSHLCAALIAKGLLPHPFLPSFALLSHRGPSLHQTSAAILSGFKGHNPFIPRITSGRRPGASAPVCLSA